jgi:hypothetical protein
MKIHPTCSILLFAVALVSGCGNNNTPTTLGKKVLFSDSLICFNTGNPIPFEQCDSAFKLIVSLSGDCMACFKPIEEWASIADTLNKTFYINSFFIMDIADIQTFEKFIYPNIPQDLNYILNVDYYFQRKNNLMVNEIRFHGLLLNKESIVVHDSNILMDNTNIGDYIDQIKTIINQ